MNMVMFESFGIQLDAVAGVPKVLISVHTFEMEDAPVTERVEPGKPVCGEKSMEV